MAEEAQVPDGGVPRRLCAGWRSSAKGFVAAGSGPGLARTPALGPQTAALPQAGVPVATGSLAVCPEWSPARALAAGAAREEIAGVLLAVAPVAGMGRMVSAAPGHPGHQCARQAVADRL